MPDMSRSQFLKLAAAGGVATVFGYRALRSAADEAMRTKPIPKSGEALPVVGLGTSRVFNIGAGEAERDSRREVLNVLFASGGRVIDTSPMYGNAERVVGDLLVELGDVERPFIATKVWTHGGANGVAQMNESMDLLRKRPLDLIQVHNLVDLDTHLETLRGWKEEGRIRYLGITHYTTAALDELTRIVETEVLDFVQCAYSINVRAAERRLLPACQAHGVATLINRPYERGAVFARVRQRPLPDWAADFDCASWGQFFLKFILGHPAATCVIPGTSKAKHMRDNTGAGFGRLPDDAERARMVALWEEL